MDKISKEVQKKEFVFELPISMIDVVFLLLIFFIIAAKFRTLEHRLDANLPKDEGQMAKQKELEKPEEIRIKMDRGEGPNSLIIKANEYPVPTMKDLYPTLKRLQAGLGELPVVIDARQNVKFMHVIEALDTCARANIKEVKFQAPPVPGGGGDDWWYK